MKDGNSVQRSCPCCGGSDIKEQLVWGFDKEKLKLHLGKCSNCNMVYVTNSDEVDMSNQAFVSWVPDTDIDVMTPVKLQRNKDILDFVSTYIPNDASILDYGSGYCGFLRIAKSAGYEVEGINPCKYLADWSKRKMGINVHATFGQDFEPGKQYDFIISDQTFEHLEEPTKDLEKLHQLLKKDGYVYIDVPNLQTYRRFIHGIDCLKDIMHYNYFTTSTLTSMCKNKGFRIVKVAPTVGKGFFKRLSKSILDRLGVGDCSVLLQKID